MIFVSDWCTSLLGGIAVPRSHAVHRCCCHSSRSRPWLYGTSSNWWKLSRLQGRGFRGVKAAYGGCVFSCWRGQLGFVNGLLTEFSGCWNFSFPLGIKMTPFNELLQSPVEFGSLRWGYGSTCFCKELGSSGGCAFLYHAEEDKRPCTILQANPYSNQDTVMCLWFRGEDNPSTLSHVCARLPLHFCLVISAAFPQFIL